jgi:hypothetical protein
MPVMIEVTNPLAREQTMTKVLDRAKIVRSKRLWNGTRILCAPRFRLLFKRRWKLR